MWKDLPFKVAEDFTGFCFIGLCFPLLSSLMLERSDEVLSLLSSSGFFRLFGRKQNGMADMRAVTPAMIKPSHHAPTQRESLGVMVMLPRIKWDKSKL